MRSYKFTKLVGGTTAKALSSSILGLRLLPFFFLSLDLAPLALKKHITRDVAIKYYGFKTRSWVYVTHCIVYTADTNK